ncbi:MAG: 50S ribosomal protein L6 [Parcubacteria group bacterium GW2011_GWC1_38_6]|nr:MAG: 50S ribosomal protein L6 [Parcubacteria group bacterium GW2011_GWA1_36_12]KKQ77316.1 MAG: 50S ribosomal protein L6 [Parcubacteria group bacterium GW2011_GWC1_38_6]
MSRIGKKIIIIPEGVDVKNSGLEVIIKGPKGELQRNIHPDMKVEIRDGQISVSPQVFTKQSNALWGLTRALLYNMVEGVTKGYERKLSIEGIGFKVVLDGSNLVLSVGLSHTVPFEAPKGITFATEKNVITVSGIDKELVSQTAANIRKISPPEPYKGKGIRYLGEVVRKKVGKKAVASQ